MKTVRTIVRNQMRELGLKPYDVAKAVRGKVTSQTVYNFVLHGREMNTKSLAFLLDAIGLEIRPKNGIRHNRILRNRVAE